METFGSRHPGLAPVLFIEPTRTVLDRHHGKPPAIFEVLCWKTAPLEGAVQFSRPDDRSRGSLEAERFVEIGAIVMAGLILDAFTGKQITRVLQRRGRADYFVGEHPHDFRWILEVGGTTNGSAQGLLQTKRKQLLASDLRRGPAPKDGFVAATRFARDAVTMLDFVPAERDDG